MTAQEIKQAAATYAAKRLTKADKQAIADIVTPFGVVIRSSTCRNCYIDALMEAYNIAARAEQAEAAPATAGSHMYKFKFRAPVTVSGRTYSALTPEAVIRHLERREPALFNAIYKRVALAPVAAEPPAPATETEQTDSETTDNATPDEVNTLSE